MNCAGDTRGMLSSILKMEKAAILAPRLAEHIEFLIGVIHRDHKPMKLVPDVPAWSLCTEKPCQQTKSLLELAYMEVLNK